MKQWIGFVPLEHLQNYFEMKFQFFPQFHAKFPRNHFRVFFFSKKNIIWKNIQFGSNNETMIVLLYYVKASLILGENFQKISCENPVSLIGVLFLLPILSMVSPKLQGDV